MTDSRFANGAVAGMALPGGMEPSAYLINKLYDKLYLNT